MSNETSPTVEIVETVETEPEVVIDPLTGSEDPDLKSERVQDE
jgi:hypothetical protein